MAGSGESRLKVTRGQILAFRRRVGSLDERMPMGSESLRRAAWAGLQDSMPRAAVLSLHARIKGVESSSWEDSSLAQLWGPRYNAYVVPKRDFALFSLGRLPDDAKGRLRAERTAERLHGALAGTRMTDREVGRALGSRQLTEVRHDDGHGRHPLGRRPSADRLDRPRSRDTAGRRAPRARPALPPRLRAEHGCRVRPLGRDLAALGGHDVRLAGGIAAPGQVAARRRVAACRGRAGHARC